MTESPPYPPDFFHEPACRLCHEPIQGEFMARLGRRRPHAWEAAHPDCVERERERTGRSLATWRELQSPDYSL